MISKSRRCRRCGKQGIVLTKIRYPAVVRRNGRLHKFTVPDLVIPMCEACGEKIFTEKVDAQIQDALERKS